MKVALAWGGPARAREISLEVDDGATIAEVIERAGAMAPDLRDALKVAAAFGVWGKIRSVSQVLREGDRVEIYRPLQADPKDARRANARRSASGRKM